MKSRSEFIAACFTIVIVLSLVLPLTAEEGSPAATPATCPVHILKFDSGDNWISGGVHVWIKNVSGKKIVGIVFNAALADPTEHWKWLHWNYDEYRPLRDFSWNKVIKDGDTKKLSWNRADLDFEHGGGGAFVLTSVLFEDGTGWDESVNSASCKYIWYNDHKKAFFRPISLPPRK